MVAGIKIPVSMVSQHLIISYFVGENTYESIFERLMNNFIEYLLADCTYKILGYFDENIVSIITWVKLNALRIEANTEMCWQISFLIQYISQ